MLQFLSLSSGSSGNCYILAEDGQAIMLDQGIGVRTLKKVVTQYSVSLSNVTALFVTHEHFDHSRSVGETSSLLNIPVYAHVKVHEAMLLNPRLYRKVLPLLRRDVECGECIETGCFKVTAFEVPHDSAFNLGYFIETPSTNICLITDAGSFPPHVLPYINTARNLVIEANYDSDMLAHGRYPAMLKHRIATENGHSSNVQTAAILSEHLSPAIQRVFLCHLSANNNTPLLAQNTVVEALHEQGLDIPVVPLARTSPTGIFNLL